MSSVACDDGTDYHLVNILIIYMYIHWFKAVWPVICLPKHKNYFCVTELLTKLSTFPRSYTLTHLYLLNENGVKIICKI